MHTHRLTPALCAIALLPALALAKTAPKPPGASGAQNPEQYPTVPHTVTTHGDVTASRSCTPTS